MPLDDWLLESTRVTLFSHSPASQGHLERLFLRVAGVAHHSFQHVPPATFVVAGPCQGQWLQVASDGHRVDLVFGPAPPVQPRPPAFPAVGTLAQAQFTEMLAQVAACCEILPASTRIALGVVANHAVASPSLGNAFLKARLPFLATAFLDDEATDFFYQVNKIVRDPDGNPRQNLLRKWSVPQLDTFLIQQVGTTMQMVPAPNNVPLFAARLELDFSSPAQTGPLDPEQIRAASAEMIQAGVLIFDVGEQ